jgi:integrase
MIKDVRRIWERVRKLTNKEWMEIHDLRRFRGTELWEDGDLMPQEVQQLMGHGNVATTQRHYISENRKRTAKKVVNLEDGRGVN